MEFRLLGKSGLRTSEIALGCGSPTFAGRADEKTALEIIGRALDLGITCLDTGETYAEGRSETLIGKALNGKRHNVVIATKFGKDRSVGPDEQRGSRRRLMRAVEGSLRRLKTDYIDLYVFHEPDPETPIAETLRGLDDLIRAGKVRYIACSTFAAWQLCQALWTSTELGAERFIAASAGYNLIDRRIEDDLVPCCVKYGVAVVPTFPLAQGFLTGKYRRDGAPPKVARFTASPEFANPIHQDLRRHNGILNDRNFDRLAALEAFAKERGHVVGELAIAWLLSRPFVGMVPVGVTRIEHLASNVKAAAWKLTADDLAELEKIP
jgi:aryl-alcohol dehydrogenase-like predicted oxidoreductase